MKYRSRSTRYVISYPQFFLRTTPSSTKLIVSRNGIFLDIVATLSVQHPLLLVSIDHPRLLYWLNKGIHINVLHSSSVNTTFHTFLSPLGNVKKK